MRKFLILCFFALISGMSMADEVASEGQVSGKIFDSKTKEPLPFVNVAVKKSGETVYLQLGASTDTDGFFTIGLPFGSYTLTATFVGYVSQDFDVVLSAKTPKIVLKDIFLNEDSQVIEEVKVTGMRSQMKFELDKKVFNVDQNIANAGGSASEVLGNIPSVEVDNEGEISLRGNTSVTVWINGKASGLSEDNRAQILEQLPAESIEKVELITNPSAKYSPEGTAGIINIVLKKNRAAGYYGSVQAGFDSQGGYNGSANFNYSSTKLEAYASVGYRKHERKGGGFTNRWNYTDTDTTTLFQNSDNSGDMNHLFTRLGLTWNVTSNDHISLGGFGMFGGGTGKVTNNYTSTVTNSFINSTRISESDDNMNVANAEFGYKHDFGENHNIDFTLSYNRWKRDAEAIYSQNSIFADLSETNTYQNQDQTFDTYSYDIQLDYVNNLNENMKIEAGYKGSFEREDTPIETFSGITASSANLDTALYNRFMYNSDIHAIYGTFSGRSGKLNYQLGLRGEYLKVNTKSLAFGETEDGVSPFENEFWSLYPSAFVSYSLPGDNELQINYTRRVRRPRGGQLNSFRDITDPSNVSFGNPELDPQFSNAFELNYIKNWDEHMISLSAYYRNTNNEVERIRYLVDDVMYSTFENVAQSSSTGLELVVKNKLFKRLELTSTLNLYRYALDEFSFMPAGATAPVIGEASDDFSWNFRMIANIMLPKRFSLQLNGRYSAKELIAQGYREPSYTIDAGLRKSIGDFNISLNVRDIFDSRKRESSTSGTGFYQESQNWWGGRTFRISVTYSFGNMKPKRDQNQQQGQEVDTTGGYGTEEF